MFQNSVVPVDLVSPLTGVELKAHSNPLTGVVYFPDTIGNWAISSSVRESGFEGGSALQTKALALSQKETLRLLRFVRSKIFEFNKRGDKPMLILEERHLLATNENLREDHRPVGQFGGYRLVSLEALVEEAAQLSLRQKAAKTLENIADLEDAPGKGVLVSYTLEPYPGCPEKGVPNSHPPHDVAYACSDLEVGIVFHELLDRGLLRRGRVETRSRPNNAGGSIETGVSQRLLVSPSGYDEVHALKRGFVKPSKKSFMICRFTEVLDIVFDEVYSPVCRDAEVSCPIARVKDIHHVDAIDDRIMREIREATVVVVDLTDTETHGFNVAFEAGFALALDKPIVWTLQGDPKDLKLPFDIQMHNILCYESDDLEALKTIFKFRMIAALDKAARK